MGNSLKSKAVNAVLWRIGEQGGKQFIQFFISLILARLIAPEQFGMLAMLTVFMAVAGVFIDSGFSQALIRKNDRTQTDCSTVFWFNILVSIICYAIIFFIAPFVSDFYEMPQLTLILRVIAIGIVIGSISGVQSALLIAEMNFKLMTKFNLLSMFISGIVGIVLAYLDFKVWALVAQSLVGTVITTTVLWIKVGWRPSFVVSKDSLKEFFGFGSKLLASSLLDTVYRNIYSITIGKFYKAADLAYYNRATSFTQLTANTPTSILQSVTYPTLCKLQHDDEALKNGYRRTIKLSAFVIFPLCLGVGAVAYPLIEVLYTKVWIFAASLLSIVAFGSMWYPIHAINLNYLVVKGRSDIFFKLEVIKKIQAVIILFITLPMGLEAMCWGNVCSSLLSLIWNTHYNGKFLNMGIISQLRDLFPTLLLSAVMYVAARLSAMVLGNDIISLIVSVMIGATIYIGGAFLFRFPELQEIKNLRK